MGLNSVSYRNFALLVALLLAPGSHADSLAATSLDGLQLAQNESGSQSQAASKRRYGPIKPQDNLWSISRLYLTEGLTISQIVIAIYRANPRAFQANNINRLQLNATLKIPDDAQIRAINYAAAYREITEQMAAYEAYLEANSSSTNNQQSSPATIEVDVIDTQAIAVIKQSLVAEEAPAVSNNQIEPVVQPKPASKKPLLRYSYDFSISHDDNIRRAQNAVDIESDYMTSITLNARGGKSLGGYSLISYGASASYEAFSSNSDLNNLNFNLNAKYRFASSAAFSAPIYALGIKVGGIASELEMRDATLLTLGFEVNRWLTSTINLTAGIDHKISEAKSRVFDTAESRLFVNFDLDLSKTSLVYTTLTFITGDVVSSATPTLQIINASEAIEPDDAFGGTGANQFAYRLEGDTRVITLGYNRIFTRSTSLDLSYQFADTEATDGIVYDRSIIRASLLGRF